MSDTQQTDAPEQQPEGGEKQQEQGSTFTQADVDRIVKERVQRERAKYADYDDLKAKVGEARTAEERIATLEQEVTSSRHEALKRRVQAAHGISDEDADLFLTGADETALTAQAQRLAARESERKNNGNHVPPEGKTPSSSANGSSWAGVLDQLDAQRT